MTFAAVLAAAALASAPAADVRVVEGTAANNFVNRFEPATLSIVAGDSVTWHFDGTTLPHNVANEGPEWTFRSGQPAPSGPAGTYTFSTPGTYTFACEIHTTTMRGSVTVSAPGQPPPPPPPAPTDQGPQPLFNTEMPPAGFERPDTTPPRLTAVRVRGQRLRFRLSEWARVTVRVKRGKRVVRTVRLRAEEGIRTLTVRGLHKSYRVELRAVDGSGNRSPIVTAKA